jgi:hypothetical protein
MSKFPAAPHTRRRDVLEILAASRPPDLEPSHEPTSADAAAIAAAEPTPLAHAGKQRRSRVTYKRVMITIGIAFSAAAVAVALILSAVPGAPAQSRTGKTATASHHPKIREQMTARGVLLMAAANVRGGLATGKYWRETMVEGVTVPGGTTAHPYDISVRTYGDRWNPRSAGRREWLVSQQLGTRPATKADAAQWRAAGSPSNWRSGKKPNSTLGGYPVEWTYPFAASTVAAPRSAGWQVSGGTVGFIEGDLAGLDAAQFRKLPTRPRLVAALLHRYALRAHCHYKGCSTVHQLIWSEALMLLQDPVSPQVRSATFKVMAGLPGVRLIGAMTDPLGRHGYAIAPGGVDPNAYPPDFNPTRIVLIDPASGSLLATEYLGPMPRTVHCLSFDAANKCTGSTYVGRSYRGQLDGYVAVLGAGWTNASPALPPPSARSGNDCCAGLPPLP